MGLETLDDDKQNEQAQNELGDDWMAIPVDVEVTVQKQTEIIVKAGEIEKFKEHVQQELSTLNSWVSGRVFKHPDVIVDEITDPDKLAEKHFTNE